jgi:hypothetical protein
VYDSSVLTLKQGPSALETGDAADRWIRRAPSFAMFDVSKEGRMTRLLVISVHAKSGGGDETKADVAMIGRAVDKLKNDILASSASGATQLSVLVTGDFNLDPKNVKQAFRKSISSVDSLETFGWSESCIAPDINVDKLTCSNIWEFNGSGDIKKDGKSYDSAFFWSSDSTIMGGLAPIPDYDKAVTEMHDVAKAIVDFLQTYQNSSRSSPLSEMTEDVLKSLTKTEANVVDETPSWLRMKFQKSVKLHWSDHKPIKMTITI